MSILFWLLPALLITCAASGWAAWTGRGRPHLSEQSEEAQALAYQRMAQAIAKPNVGQRPERSRERSTGVAVRRSR